jgi:hypothetical protein
MGRGGCAACGPSRGGWFWHKLGSSLPCIRLAWWAMLVAWLLLAVALIVELPMGLRKAVGMAALAFSLLWIAHWGAFVLKRLAATRKHWKAEGEAFSRRDVLTAVCQQLVGAILWVCWRKASAQDQEPSCEKHVVEVIATGTGSDPQQACRNARAKWHAQAEEIRLKCPERCGDRRRFCQSGDCVCEGVEIVQAPQCGRPFLDRRRRWICRCRGRVAVSCWCLPPECTELGLVLVHGNEVCPPPIRKELKSWLSATCGERPGRFVASSAFDALAKMT